MMFEIIPQELHEQLLDLKDYQNRTNGVDELKSILFDMDLKPVSSDNIEQFISFLRRLLDDTNFKVFYGTLQVINLLIEKLASSVDKHVKHIVGAVLKTLGDTRVIARIEYMSSFTQLMKLVGPQKVLDLIIGQLRHKNSRVREDVINIIIAGMLTHPRKDFNIPSLCHEVAPCLADSKKTVRHAALELFAVFDYCLDVGKKQPLMRAIDRVETDRDAEGLSAAIQARRARHILPRLGPDGIVEYALVVPRPGQWGLPQFGSGADLDWVMNGCRVNSGRSLRTERNSDGSCDFGILGGYTDVFPQHRRIVSAGKGKNKFPWERMGLPAAVRPLTGKDLSRKSSEQVLSKGCPSPVLEYGGELYVYQRDCHQSRKESVGIPPKAGDVDLNPFVSMSVASSDGDAAHVHDRLSPLRGSAPLRHSSSAGLLTSSHGEPVSTPPIPVRRPLSRDAPVAREGMMEEEEEEVVDREEIMRSLRCLRFSAAKKRAKMSGLDPEQDPDSPDSAVKLELGPDSPSHGSPALASPLSESGLSSLYSPPNSTNKGSKISSGSSSSSVVKPKPRVACVFSTKTEVAGPRESSPLHGTHDVSVVGQCLAYSNGSVEQEVGLWGEEKSLPSSRPRGREPMKAVRASRGVFVSCTPLSSSREKSFDQSDNRRRSVTRSSRGVSASEAQGSPHDTHKDPEGDELRMKTSGSACQKEQELPLLEAECHQIKRISRRRLHQMASESTSEETRDWQQNGSAGVKVKNEFSSVDSLASPDSPTLKPHPPLHPRPPNKPSLAKHSPDHQLNPPAPLSPPTEPRKPKTNRPNRLRKAPSFNKTHSTFSLNSGYQPPQICYMNAVVEGVPHTISFCCSLDDLSACSQKLQPMARPEEALTESFNLLSSDDWEKKMEGLHIIRHLVHFHAELLSARLHDACIAVTDEVKNLRSGVSRVAVGTLGDFFTHLKREMDPELDYTVRVLLHKSWESNAFMRQDVDAALASMVQNCTPLLAMKALLGGGLNHLNTVVRKCTAQHLASLVEIMGADFLLSGKKGLTDRILPAIAKLAHDSSQETRHYGCQMLLFLASHKDFDKLLEHHIPAKEFLTVRNTVLSMRSKELGGTSRNVQSGWRRHSFSVGTTRTSSLSREPSGLKKEPEGYCYKGQASNIADKTEYVKKLNALMTSKDFPERIRALEQLVTDCEQNPDMVITNIFPVFDAIKARLQESNSKVNLCALQCLHKIIGHLKEHVAQVVSILVPAIVDSHLNSKNNAIYNAAMGAIHALMDNLDNTLLLQPFCSKAQFLSGRAKVDLIETVTGLVNELYPRKPQLVEQKALPLLWYLLGTSNKGASMPATAVLCQALHAHMGPNLAECASSQHPSIYKSFNKVLKTLNSH